MTLKEFREVTKDLPDNTDLQIIFTDETRSIKGMKFINDMENQLEIYTFYPAISKYIYLDES